MTWFSFQGGYGTIDFTGANEKAAAGLGFHGYATEAEAKAHPNSVNALQAAPLTLLIDQQAGALPSGPPGSGALPPATANALTPSWALNVSGISGWFFRALKVLFGGVLIILGISKLTGADNAIIQLAGKIPVIP